MREMIAKYRQAIGTEVERIRESWGLPKRQGLQKKGEWYIPRKVLKMLTGEDPGPSNPNRKRFWDDANEAVNRGIDYDTDPISVLDLHLRQM